MTIAHRPDDRDQWPPGTLVRDVAELRHAWLDLGAALLAALAGAVHRITRRNRP